MKKKILLALMLPLLLIPLTTHASKNEIKYESMNLKETLESENIELAYKDYKETDKQVTIYMFRGTGCTYCRSFLEYLNSITEEYGKYFKLVSYEVWTHENNADLLTKTAEFLGKKAGGVPFIVIGDQVFPGYSSEFDTAIKSAIKELYDSKDRYDVMDEIEKKEAIERRKEFFRSAPFIITCNTLITLVAVLIVGLTMNKKMKALTSEVEALEAKVKVSNNKEVKESKIEKEAKEVREEKQKNKNKEKSSKKKSTK